MLRRVCACGSALNFLSTPEYRAQAPRGLADPTPTTQNPRVNRRLRPSTMLCFRCRAVPSLRTSVSSMQTPINRYAATQQQPTSTPEQGLTSYPTLQSQPSHTKRAEDPIESLLQALLLPPFHADPLPTIADLLPATHFHPDTHCLSGFIIASAAAADALFLRDSLPRRPPCHVPSLAPSPEAAPWFPVSEQGEEGSADADAAATEGSS